MTEPPWGTGRMTDRDDKEPNDFAPSFDPNFTATTPVKTQQTVLNL